MKRLTANIAGRDKRFAWLERFVGHGSGFLLLAPFPGYRVLHLHHHANTNDPAEDPDYWVKSRTWLGSVPRCIVIQPVYIFHLWKLARDPRTRRAFAMEMVYVVAYAGIVFAAFLLGFGKELILLWILPGYVGVVLCPASSTGRCIIRTRRADDTQIPRSCCSRAPSAASWISSFADTPII